MNLVLRLLLLVHRILLLLLSGRVLCDSVLNRDLILRMSQNYLLVLLIIAIWIISLLFIVFILKAEKNLLAEVRAVVECLAEVFHFHQQEVIQELAYGEACFGEDELPLQAVFLGFYD